MLDICWTCTAGVRGVSVRYSRSSVPAYLVLVKFRRFAGGGVRGGDEEIILLEGSCIDARPLFWSSISGVDGASNIGESCREG